MIKDVIVNLALNKSRDSVRDYAITVARTFDAHLAGVVFADGANLPVFLAPEFRSVRFSPAACEFHWMLLVQHFMIENVGYHVFGNRFIVQPPVEHDLVQRRIITA